jgi:hypothetical protein
VPGPALRVPLVAGELPRIRAGRRVFHLPDGSIWRWQGASAFTLLAQYIRGEDITPFIARARDDYHANLLRVFCRLSWGKLNPAAVPDYFDRLDAFLSRMERERLRVELVALADCDLAGYVLDPAEQPEFVRRVVEVASRHNNAVVELGNEPWWPGNGWRVDRFPRKPRFDILMSRGSLAEDAGPQRPVWDYLTHHASRTEEWPRRQGKQCGELSWGAGATPASGIAGVPCVDDEPMGAASEANWHRSDVPADFFAGHAVSALLAAGSTLHSEALMHGQVPKGREDECLRAAAQVWTLVPADAPLGQYTRGGLADCPLEHRDLPDPAGALRTYCQLAGAKATCVVVRPGPAHRLTARGGWRIARTAGRLDQLVFLER